MPLFPNIVGGRGSGDRVEEMLAVAVRCRRSIDDSRVAESFSRSFKRAPCFGKYA